MRARLGPASRAALQSGATFTSRDIGTLPLTAPASGVGRLFGLIGLTSPAAGPANARTDTTPSDNAAERRMKVCTTRIQPGLQKRVTDNRATGSNRSEQLAEIERSPVFGPKSQSERVVRSGIVLDVPRTQLGAEITRRQGELVVESRLQHNRSFDAHILIRRRFGLHRERGATGGAKQCRLA